MNECENRSLRPSFREAISRAERQVGYREMLQRSDKLGYQFDMEIVHELCAIMAEVYMMSPDQKIRISGEWLEVERVQSVFEELTGEHLEKVVENFSRQEIEIKNKKAYLRTMLYNSVFSLCADYRNDVKVEI